VRQYFLYGKRIENAHSVSINGAVQAETVK
jgi:hypothetical protein